MLDAKNDFFVHLKWLRRSVLAAGGELILAGDTLQALIRRGPRQLVLHPAFLAFLPDGARFSDQLLDDCNGFAGWLPARPGDWPEARDRLAFKRFAGAAGLAAPEAWMEPGAARDRVLVRSARPSSGASFLGPYRTASEHALDVDRGEFYERYIEGDAIRVWCWNGEPICGELAPQPSVVGDGASTLEDLVTRALHARGLPGPAAGDYLSQQRAFLALEGVTPATVVEEGRTVRLGMGMQGTPLDPSRFTTLDLRAASRPAWADPLRAAGAALLKAVPSAVRARSLLLLEAIIDAEGRPWLLSMHASPVVHPLVYPAIIFQLLGPRGADDLPAATLPA